MQVLGVGGSGVLTGIMQIAAGSSSSYALASDGTAYAWGRGIGGILGNGDTADSSTPVQVLGVGGSGVLSGITQVAAGTNSSYALSTSGTVYSWGYGNVGQLGQGNNTNSSTPVQVLGVGGTGALGGIVQVASGNNTVYALADDGSVYAWGNGNNGCLGNGATANSSIPVQVLGVGGAGTLGGIAQVASGSSNGYALASDGMVYSWGALTALGNGSTVPGVLSSPALGPNFQPVSMSFGSELGSGLTATGPNWSAISPAGDVGTVDIVGVAKLFGGTAPASVPTATWIAGTFIYFVSGENGGDETLNNGMLAEGGASAPVFVIGGAAALLLGAGVALAVASRRVVA